MVIIGFQVVVWMVLIVLAIFGYQWIDLTKIKDWATVISVALVGLSYTLGILFDSFTGSLFSLWEFGSWSWLVPRDRQATEPPGKMRAYIMAVNPAASHELTQRANRNSLVRATSLNLVLICITSIIWVQRQFGFSVKIDTVI